MLPAFKVIAAATVETTEMPTVPEAVAIYIPSAVAMRSESEIAWEFVWLFVIPLFTLFVLTPRPPVKR